VRAGSAPGGDGSRALPFASIAEALEVAAPTSIVALSKGVFDAPIRITRDVGAIVGACTGETSIASTLADETNPVVAIAGARARIASLSIRGERFGVWSGPDAHLEVEDVLVDGVRSFGLFATGSTVTGSGLVLRGTRPRSSDGYLGFGLRAEGGASVRLERSAIEGNRDHGVLATGGARVELSDSVIARTEPSRDRSRGFGAAANEATLVLSRSVVAENHGVGVLADSGAAELYDVVIEDHLARIDTGDNGEAVDAGDGGSVTIRRARFSGNRSFGLLIGRATVDAEDLIVRDTKLQDRSGLGGIGLYVRSGGSVSLRRALFAGNRHAGINARDPGSRITAEDLTVTGTRPTPIGLGGRGIDLQLGATMEVMRLDAEDNTDIGVIVNGEATRFAGTDVRVRTLGKGLVTERLARASIVRGLFDGNREVGLFAAGGSSLVLEDLVVRDTESSTSGEGGHALVVQGSDVESRRSLFDRNRDVALFASAGATVRLSDVQILNTLEKACAATTCPDRGGGIAMCASEGASIALEEFAIADNALCGVYLVDGGTADLHMGTVRGHPIGASVLTDGFDVARLSNGVVFEDNTATLEATRLPIPGERSEIVATDDVECRRDEEGCECTHDPAVLVGSCLDPRNVCFLWPLAPNVASDVATCVRRCPNGDADCADSIVGPYCRSGICMAAESGPGEVCEFSRRHGEVMAGCAPPARCFVGAFEDPHRGSCGQPCTASPQNPSGGCTGARPYCNPEGILGGGVCSDRPRAIGGTCHRFDITRGCDTAATQQVACLAIPPAGPDSAIAFETASDFGICVALCDPTRANACPALMTDPSSRALCAALDPADPTSGICHDGCDLFPNECTGAGGGNGASCSTIIETATGDTVQFCVEVQAPVIPAWDFLSAPESCLTELGRPLHCEAGTYCANFAEGPSCVRTCDASLPAGADGCEVATSTAVQCRAVFLPPDPRGFCLP
jgi:hypothetical protein